MFRLFRSALTTLVIASSASLFIAHATATQAGRAPAQGAVSAPSITPEQAAPFMGDWLVSLSMGAGEATQVVSIKADAGRVTATVSSDMQPALNVTDISLSGKSLVLKYVSSMQGNPIPSVMTLTPDATGPALRANLSVMDGQYEMAGTAAKQAPGAPIRAGGFGGPGGGRGSMTSEASDFTPKKPYIAHTPEDEAKGFMLPTGYRLELVMADPQIISPTLIEFDGNGRMYVGEMISYMMDAGASREHEPISRISRWESTKGDGHYDKRTVFVDKLVAPRMILPLQDGVILTSETDSDDLVKWTDTNGDGVADKREVVFTGIGQSGDANIEHQKAGLLWNMDNWIYTTYNPFRIRWTPSGFLREPTGANGGQWGLASDDDGKPWFVDAGGERGPMNFQFPVHYGSFTPCPAAGRGGRAGAPAAPPPAPNPNCPAGMENGFEKDFAVVWPAPGIGDMQGGLPRTRMPAQNLNHFTAATGPAIVRGDRLPADLKGDLLFTEPVGRLIRRAKIDNVEGLTQLRNVYPQSEFLTSTDQLFRPVNISNGPDGTVYIADMYHGIIQELQWSGPGSYLRAKIEQYQLDKVAQHGRIWRLRYDGREAVPATETNIGQTAIPAITPDFTAPRMYSETPAQLVAHLSHPNGWWRDTAQRLLILKQDKSVVPALEQTVRSSDNLLARFHALWTLEGLGALNPALVRSAMEDKNPRMRIQAIRASETLYKAGDKSFAGDYRALTKDPDTNVVIQALLTATLFKLADAPDLVKAAQSANNSKGVALIGERLLAPAPAFGGGAGRRGGPLTPDEEKRLQQGNDVFGAVCFACHGPDGSGAPLEGAPAGTMMAPPLAASPRVQGHRDYVIKVLLRGLQGPLDGKTYRDVMVPMGGTDEWVAGIASYVRTSFGNNGGLVTPADVARVRAEIADRTNPWTIAELEASLPRPLDSQQWKLSASHGSETAGGASTLRGWSTGAPQAAGMWFSIELPQPAVITEVQFDSTASMGGGGRGGRGQGPAPGAGAPAGATAPTASAPAAGQPAPAPDGAAAAPGAQTGPQGRGGRGGFGGGGGPQVIGYPRAYSVQVSTDGTNWSKPVAEGKGDGAHTTITFAPTRAKFVKITETETPADPAPWSIRSLRVYEAPAKK
jgi:mono/diheme cytochrome c family protein